LTNELRGCGLRSAVLTYALPPRIAETKE